MNGLSKVKDYAKRSTIFQEFGPSIEELETDERSLLPEKDNKVQVDSGDDDMDQQTPSSSKTMRRTT